MANSLANIIYGYRANIPRWALYLGTPELEGTGNAGTNVQLTRYSDVGNIIDNPLFISRATGIAAFSQSPTAPTPPPGDNSISLATTAFVTNAVSGGGSFLPIIGGTLTGPLTINSTLGVTGQTTLGVATATTPPQLDNSTRVATTAYINTALGNLRWNGTFA